MKPGPRTISTLDHIKANVVVTATGCHEWQGRVNNEGYGLVGHNGGEVLVHRHVYAEECGPLDCLEQVLHECDNPPCCNPEHLTKGDQSRNLRDCYARGRRSPTRIPEATKKAILAAFGTGTYREVAARIGVSRMTVVRTYEQAGLTRQRN